MKPLELPLISRAPQIFEKQRNLFLFAAVLGLWGAVVTVLPTIDELVYVRVAMASLMTILLLLRNKIPFIPLFISFYLALLVSGYMTGIISGNEYRSLVILSVSVVMCGFMLPEKAMLLVLLGGGLTQAAIGWDIYQSGTSAFRVGLIGTFVSAVSVWPVLAMRRTLSQQLNSALMQAGEIRMLESSNDKHRSLNERQNENFREFIYAISHDLRAPIRAISGFVKMLATDSDKKLAPQEHMYLERIEAASGRLNGMVERLTQLSRLQTNTRDLVAINLSKLLGEMGDVYRKRYSEDIEFRIDQDMALHGDLDEVSLMFNELIDNACKNLQPIQRGKIHLGVTLHNKERVFFVEDNGIGVVSAHDLEEMTKLFRTIHAGEKSNGVGLSIASFVVEKMGGLLKVSSPGENQGTRIDIILPN